MKRLCVLPCGAKKIWDVEPDTGSIQAEHAYLSPFHRACQRYAKTFFHDWVILSGKHGFLKPDDCVPENYDVTFGTNQPEIIRMGDLKQQYETKHLDQFDEIVVLGGRKFRPIIDEVFQEPHKVRYPLSKYKGIGYMLKALNEAVEREEEINN
ncbi:MULTISPECIES: DUF6884 domain-containing protein [Bacillus]|uniref:DUF6884 domain-containing protein n=2 Tax=Bacillus TaxID=1386 RepID=A0A0M5JH16_9BACI|nr:MULTISPECIES: DUF6884 domain-containing protein [Bacillus]ALC82914.1 hypothetical protein AM592_15955 [Bacillus gobiensis]MBP1081894.1 hypothetical protein [Bacillus capparidis]MED1096541.1 hypothetical protein [Bacillus capparidis]